MKKLSLAYPLKQINIIIRAVFLINMESILSGLNNMYA